MREAFPARLLRIHISESDRYQGRPLREVIVDKCRELRIAGATVFRGLEGFGETTEIHRSHLLHPNRPILIVIVDSEERVAALAEAVEEMMDTGLMAWSKVAAVRVQRDAPPEGEAAPSAG